MSRPITRIVTASGVAVILVALALTVTVLSYRRAVHAHLLAAVSSRENNAAQSAETRIWREREAMDEYLFTRDPEILAEISAINGI
jgi:hypothetical protein